LADGVEWRTVDGEIVALDIKKGIYFALNRTGALLWESLSAGTTEPALASQLVERFDLDPTAAQGDLDEFLAGLRTNGLLVET